VRELDFGSVVEANIVEAQEFGFAARGYRKVFAAAHGKEEGADCEIGEGGEEWGTRREASVGVHEPEMCGRDGRLSVDGGIGVTPGLKEACYGGQQLVGAVRVVNGAWPLSTPELRCQEASGLSDSAAK
jgi:hypothetical protein